MPSPDPITPFRPASLLALALICGTPCASWSAPLGRLFFTPEERQRPTASPAPTPSEAAPEAPPAPAPAQRLDGIVRRVRDGHTILFLDGIAEPRPAHLQADGQIRFKSESGTVQLARIGASARPAP